MRVPFFFLFLLTFFACSDPQPTETASSETESHAPQESEEDFEWVVDRFADIQILRYQIPGFDQLSLSQKKLVYYLTQAGLAGRDIIYAQNYRHNLEIRRALENIINNYQGSKDTEDWKAFMTYAKQVFFANGIHHHYSKDKFQPEFDKSYFDGLLKASNTAISDEALAAIFEGELDAKKVSLDSNKDLIANSAVNHYGPGVTEKEVEAFYAKKMANKDDAEPISYGLNSRLVRGPDGKLQEEVYSANGTYAAAIKEIQKWLRLAVGVAENEPQKKALELLVEYYENGDLKKWDEYNIAWVKATEGDIDYINGFIETYEDPKGFKATYETIVQINDFKASEQMGVVAANAQWFEDNSVIMKAHKKESAVGISYKVVNVAGEAGDASPSTPIGVNLPNADWIRANHGSKSVSLGNIEHAYNEASGPGLLSEFAHDPEEIERSKQYGTLAGEMQTALHEVIGHASGQLEPQVATPKETLKNYASALEEARADLVALYFLPDAKIKELGLVPNEEVAKAEYDSYIRNGLMLQLRRLEVGKNVEQAHMRNRQMVASWVFERGSRNGAIEKVVRDGKTYFNILDYDKMRVLFGELLREVQRIKSQGDYAAGKALIEDYGVQVDRDLHEEVLRRSEKLDLPPYGGFINPKLVPVKNDAGEITDVRVAYPKDFVGQMLEYGAEYGFLK